MRITTQQLKSFDMYVQTGSSTFKIENCSIYSRSFDLNRTDQFKVQLEGQGTKLSRAGDEKLFQFLEVLNLSLLQELLF